MNRKLASHAYNHVDKTDEQEAFQSLAVVKTTSKRMSPSVYFFGDPCGFLPWRNIHRSFETLEATITFEEEEEEEDVYSQQLSTDQYNADQEEQNKQIQQHQHPISVLTDERENLTKEEIFLIDHD